MELVIVTHESDDDLWQYVIICGADGEESCRSKRDIRYKLRLMEEECEISSLLWCQPSTHCFRCCGREGRMIGDGGVERGNGGIQFALKLGKEASSSSSSSSSPLVDPCGGKWKRPVDF